MAFLQYFAAGLLALGIFAIIASIVSPDQGGPGTIAAGVGALVVGIAVFVVGSRRGSSS